MRKKINLLNKARKTKTKTKTKTKNRKERRMKKAHGKQSSMSATQILETKQLLETRFEVIPCQDQSGNRRFKSRSQTSSCL